MGLEKTIVAFEIIVLAVLVGVAGVLVWESTSNQMESVLIVSLKQSILNVLNDGYSENPAEEFVLCLNGDIENGVAEINGYEMADIIQTFPEEQKVSAKCPTRSIATIHNHQSGVCKLSSDDIYSFGALQDPIIGIICGEDRIVFFTPQSLDKSVDVNIFE